jgi:hypothetical protein
VELPDLAPPPDTRRALARRLIKIEIDSQLGTKLKAEAWY